jgi:hypothetical protein
MVFMVQLFIWLLWFSWLSCFSWALFIFICFLRRDHFTSEHHVVLNQQLGIGILLSFVVWLFLFLSIYWFGVLYKKKRKIIFFVYNIFFFNIFFLIKFALYL